MIILMQNVKLGYTDTYKKNESKTSYENSNLSE